MDFGNGRWIGRRTGNDHPRLYPTPATPSRQGRFIHQASMRTVVIKFTIVSKRFTSQKDTVFASKNCEKKIGQDLNN